MSEDECQSAKIIYFYKENTDEHEKRKQAGLWEGVIEFMRAFVNEEDDYDSNPVETISTTLFTVSIKEVEKDMYLCLILSHENLYSDNVHEHGHLTISSYKQEQSFFREEDTHIFKDVLVLYYDLFKLFHRSITELFEKDVDLLRKILSDFTYNFDQNYFHTEWGKTYFNNCVFRGFNIAPLDSKMYLYATKHINAVKTEFEMIEKICVFYKHYHLYSDLPQETVEILHTYLIGDDMDNWITANDSNFNQGV